MKKHWIWKIVLLILIVATTAFIWSHSLQDSTHSAAESGRLRALLADLLGEEFVTAVFTVFPIRKMAHFVEFGVLGVEWAVYRRFYAARFWPRLICVIAGPLTAAVDECLQFFSPGRSPQVSDVLLDSAGFLLGYGAVLLLFWMFRKNKLHSRTKKA